MTMASVALENDLVAAFEEAMVSQGPQKVRSVEFLCHLRCASCQPADVCHMQTGAQLLGLLELSVP